MIQDLDKVLVDLESFLEDVRQNAIMTLMHADDVRAIPHLEDLGASDPSPEIRFVAKKALHLMRQRAVAMDHPEELTDSVTDISGRKTNLNMVRQGILSPQPETRARALIAIVLNKHAGVLPLLQELARKEKDPTVRANMLVTVAILGDESVVPFLAAFREDPERQVRIHLATALHFVGSLPAYGHLLLLRGDDDPKVSKAASRIFKRMGRDRLVEILGQLAVSSDGEVAHVALSTMMKSRHDEMVPIIARWLDDPDPRVVEAIRRNLEQRTRAGSKQAREFLDGRRKVEPRRKPAAKAGPAKRPRDATPPTKTPAAERPLPSPTGGPAAAPAPVPAPPAAPPSLSGDPFSLSKAELGSDGSLDESAIAPEGNPIDHLQAIVNSGSRAAVPELMKRLREEKSPAVKAGLVTALGQLRGEAAVDLIRENLASDDGGVRASAVEALVRLGDASLPDDLRRLVEDEDLRVRSKVVLALLEHDRKSAFRGFSRLVGSAERDSRLRAIDLVLEAKDDEMIAGLADLLLDDDEEVQGKARECLYMLVSEGNAKAIELHAQLRKDLNARQEAEAQAEREQREQRRESEDAKTERAERRKRQERRAKKKADGKTGPPIWKQSWFPTAVGGVLVLLVVLWQVVTWDDGKGDGTDKAASFFLAKQFKGSVEVALSEESAFAPLDQGAKLSPGARIRCGDDGSVWLFNPGQNFSVILYGGGLLRIEKLHDAADVRDSEATLRLSAGLALFDFKNSLSRHVVRTEELELRSKRGIFKVGLLDSGQSQIRLKSDFLLVRTASNDEYKFIGPDLITYSPASGKFDRRKFDDRQEHWMWTL